jgi:hypothetical protein
VSSSERPLSPGVVVLVVVGVVGSRPISEM